MRTLNKKNNFLLYNMKQQVKLYKIKGNPNNPRIIKNDKFKKLVKSIQEFPEMLKLRPIVVDEDFMVLGGNMRLKASKDAGLKEVWIEIAEGLTEEQKKEFIVKDNVGFGEWEWDMLANEWDSVQLAEWGLDVWENQDDKEPEAGLIEDDEIPEVKESKVKRGDIWQLGEHRLMCGDSTSSDDVAKLMNGEKADMVFTDPPYGMNFQSNFREKTPTFSKIENDDKILDIAPILLLNTKPDSAIYLCTRWDVYPSWYNQMDESFSIKNCIVWYKKGGGLGDLKNSYSPNHEFIIVGHNGKAELKGKRHSDVWEIARDGFNNYKHPTQKPIGLSSFAINNHSDKNDLLLDLFLGSGSTLIAAEKLNRKCYGMELDEKYCDVIIERWEQFTGQKAIKNGTK